MNLDHPSAGHRYRLGRLALRLHTFTVAELVRLTGIVQDTVYGFVSMLMHAPQPYLEAEQLPRETPGRPIKRYTLTEAGVDYLLRKNARLAAALREDDEVAQTSGSFIQAEAASPAEPAAAEYEVAEEAPPRYMTR